MDREIRILHTADTHLGYRQYHSEVRRQDFFKAFEFVIKDAIEMQVDAVVHAGDLFDSRNPTLEDLLETMIILSRLKAESIPFFGIVGNHESKQNTQWLDLFEEMGLAARLGTKPQVVGDGNAAVYGIDSVPKSKIPLYDFSGFEAPENCTALYENCWKLLVMHQIVQPFPYADWDCAEILEKLPFRTDAILLGDYHKYEKFKVGETWVTYPGSTERNSASEIEPRSYNIITLSEDGIEISKRTIPTRKFLSPIRVKLNGEEKPYEQIFSAINEHLEELSGSVVFLEISGDSGTVLSFSEIEDYLLNRGVLVSKVNDLRKKESLPEDMLIVTFSDPDKAVANEIRRLSLNDGGLIVDEIVRTPNIARSRVDEETEDRLSKLIEAKVTDFKDPNFRIEVHTTSEDEIEQVEELKTAEEIEFIREIKSEFSAVNLQISGQTKESILESEERSVSAISSKSSFKLLSESVPCSTSESVSESASEPLSGPQAKSVLEPNSYSTFNSNSEPVSGLVPEFSPTSDSKSVFQPEPPKLISNNPEIGIKITKKDDCCELKPEKELGNESGIEPEGLPEPEIEPEAKISPEEDEGYKTDEKLQEGETAKQSEDKPYKTPEEKPARSSEISGRTGKMGPKRGKGKPAVPRQYNLGDYL